MHTPVPMQHPALLGTLIHTSNGWPPHPNTERVEELIVILQITPEETKSMAILASAWGTTLVGPHWILMCARQLVKLTTRNLFTPWKLASLIQGIVWTQGIQDQRWLWGGGGGGWKWWNDGQWGWLTTARYRMLLDLGSYHRLQLVQQQRDLRVVPIAHFASII